MDRDTYYVHTLMITGEYFATATCVEKGKGGRISRNRTEVGPLPKLGSIISSGNAKARD